MTHDLALHPRPAPLPAAAGVLMAALAKVLVWFVPIVFLVPVVLYAVVAALGGALANSGVAVGVAHNAPMWFLFAMGATLATQYLPVHVAHGMTRRSFAAALTATLLGAAALLALVLPVGFLVESWLFAALAWTRDGSVAPLDAVGAFMVDAFLRFGSMASLGVLAAIAFYRRGAWWGTVAALVTVGVPGVFVLYLLGEAGAWVAPPARAALLAAAIIAVNAASHALIRGATIRGKPA